MKDLSHWMNRLEFILLYALYIHYLITSNRVIIIKLTVVVSLFDVIIINRDINNPEFHIKRMYLYLKASTTSRS